MSDNDIKRVDNTVLPDTAELSRILETEVFFPIADGKVDIHYPEFGTIISLLETLGVETAVFTKDISDIHEAVTEGQKLIDEAVIKLIAQQPNDETIALLNAVYEYLSETDELKAADMIFVFGGKTPLRMECAAQLFNDGMGESVFISGGNPIYSGVNQMSEAERYYKIGSDGGIPKGKMILETNSITMPDNVRCSLAMMKALPLDPQSIILVNSPYTARRGWALFKKHLPESVELIRVNSATKPEYAPDEWYLQERTARVVLNEFVKMRASVVHNTA
jgi:uncharacterized SAM-binding protein YcdF (DUF218 family)